MRMPEIHDSSAARYFLPDATVELPFAVTEHTPALVRITMDPLSVRHRRLAEPVSHRWIHGFHGLVEVDMHRLAMIDSMVAAWLIQLARDARPGRVVVRQSNPRIREILRALGITAVVAVE
jgi:hypothetical protein